MRGEGDDLARNYLLDKARAVALFGCLGKGGLRIWFRDVSLHLRSQREERFPLFFSFFCCCWIVYELRLGCSRAVNTMYLRYVEDENC